MELKELIEPEQPDLHSKFRVIVKSVCGNDNYAAGLDELLKKELIKPDFFLPEHSLGRYLITEAVGHNAYKNAKVLLKNGANPNVIGINPRAILSQATPLSLAIELENFKMVRLLLKYKAEPNMASNLIRLPLMQAVDQRALPGDTQKMKEIIMLLLEYKADPLADDTVGACLQRLGGKIIKVYTPLELARARGYTDIVKLFESFKK